MAMMPDHISVNIKFVATAPEYAKWWEEQTEAHNKFADLAQATGVTIPCGGGDPPPLNADGSLDTSDQLAANAWCPTGPGGGKDNSCPPGGGGGGEYPLSKDYKDLKSFQDAVYEHVKKNQAEYPYLPAQDAATIAYTDWQKQWKPPGFNPYAVPPVYHPPEEGAKPTPKEEPKAEVKEPTKGPVKEPLKVSDTPQFVSSQKKNVEVNEKAAKEMQDLAKAGKLDELKAHEGTPSPKLMEYKSQLIKEVTAGGKDKLPPEPPKPKYDSGYSEAAAPTAGFTDVGKVGKVPEQIKPVEVKPEPEEKPPPAKKQIKYKEFPPSEIKPEWNPTNPYAGKAPGSAGFAPQWASLQTGDDLKSYISDQGAKSVGFTKSHLEKIAHMNEDGIKNGVFYTPKVWTGGGVLNKPKMAEMGDYLKTILPPGTKVMAKDVTLPMIKALKLTKGEMGVSTFTEVSGKTTEHPTEFLGKSSTPKSHQADPYSKWMNPVIGGKVLVESSPGYNAKVHGAWVQSLNSEEANAVGSWKGSAKGIRISYAKGEPSEKGLAFVSAISKSPPYQGVVYRGIHSDYAEKLGKEFSEQVGKQWSDPAGPHCCSIRPSVAHGFSSGQLMLRIQTKSGRPIQDASGYSHEKECTGMPGTKYLIQAVHQNVKLHGQTDGKVKYLVDLMEI